MIAFGLGWFFIGHIIESTVLPLELFFPHRNYLPAIGLYVALAYGAHELLLRTSIKSSVRKVAATAMLCVFGGTLALGTTLWGDRAMSAEMWYIYNRDSERAARYLYSYYYREEELGVARQLNKKFVEDFPDSPAIAIESLTICEFDQGQFREKVDRAVKRISEASKISIPTASAIEHMTDTASQGLCQHFSLEDVDRLLEAAIRNNSERLTPLAKQALLIGKARIAYEKDQPEEALSTLERAYWLQPSLGLAIFIAKFYRANEDRESAEVFLKRAIDNVSFTGIKKVIWEARLRAVLNSLTRETLGERIP